MDKRVIMGKIEPSGKILPGFSSILKRKFSSSDDAAQGVAY